MQRRQKARDKPDGSKSTRENQSTLNVVLFALQCAQRIGQWITLMFIAQVVSGQIAIIINPVLKTTLTDFMEACRPVYQLGIGAYFGKAAVENVLKIAKNAKSIQSYTEVDDDDGNG